MDLRQYAHILRAHWLSIGLVVVVSTAAAATLAWTRTPEYAATTQLFVSNNSKSTGSLSEDYAGILLSQQRVASYTQLLTSSELLDPIAADLHVSAKDLQGKIKATAPAGTSLIDITITDRSPVRAKAVADALDKQFPAFVASLETPTGQTTGPPVKVSVTGAADLPTHPVSPRKKLYLVLGVFLGLLLGGGAVVVSEALDRRIRDAHDAAAVAGTQALGTIAEYRPAKRQPLVMVHAPTSARAEEIRRLRTNLQFLIEKSEGRAIVVTSAAEGEGKTFVACNLAIAFAQAGRKVALVDADLRRPRVDEMMSLGASSGLTDVLRGELQAPRALRLWRAGLDLEVLAGGRPRENASELLGSRAFTATLAYLEEHADIVIIDTPALLPATDAAVVAKLTSGAVVVARAGSTRAHELESAIESLESVEARVLGLVVNRIPPRTAAPRYGFDPFHQRLTDLEVATQRLWTSQRQPASEPLQQAEVQTESKPAGTAAAGVSRQPRRK
jgi:succinoglycan biosynthesis transport protein ExoP